MTKTIQSSTIGQAKKKERGFTLIEIMIALGIMGTGIAAIMYYQGKTEGSQKAQATVQDTTTLASKIKAMYGPQNSYAELSSATAAPNFQKMGIIPAGFTYTGTDAAGKITDAYGNDMVFSGGPTTFTISVGGTTGPLQNDECAAIAAGIRGNAMAIQVGDTAVGAAGIATASAGSTYKAVTGVLTASNLATGCNTTAPKVVMQFR